MNESDLPPSLERSRGFHPRIGCYLCRDGSPPIPLRCWQCSFEFHVHPQSIAHIPEGANTMVLCPDPVCRAPNVFLRVSPAYGYLVNPTDWQESQRAAWWGNARRNGHGR
jgi:hypothetical protein